MLALSDNLRLARQNDVPVLVSRPRREHYSSQYMSTYIYSDNFSVHCWDWISHEGTEMLHNIFVEGHPYRFQFKHIFTNVTVPSLNLFYRNGAIQFQSKHSTFCFEVQECLSLQNDVKFPDWPPQLPAAMTFPHHRVTGLLFSSTQQPVS